MKTSICPLCTFNKGVYNVIAPTCIGSQTVKLCPSCFQLGIDMGEIVWIGDKPYGICQECLDEQVSA